MEITKLFNESNYFSKSEYVKFQQSTLERVKLPNRDVTITERFNDDNVWILQSPSGNTKTIDTVNTLEYVQSLKVTNTNPTSTNATVRKSTVNYDLSKYTAFDLKVFVEDVTKVDRIVVGLSTDATFANWGQYTFLSTTLKTGWNHLTISLKRGAFSGNFTGSNVVTVAQIRLQAKANTTASISLQEFSLVYANETKVHFTFDDCWDSQKLAISELLSRSMVVSLGVIKRRIDTSGYLTLGELREYYASGCDLINHTDTHINNNTGGLPTLAYEAQKNEIMTCTKYLEDNRFFRGSRCIYYPYGQFNADTFKVMNENGFVFGRSLLDKLEPREATNLFDCKAVNLIPSVTAQDAINAVNDARDCGVVITFLNHRFTTDTTVTDTMFWYMDRWIELLNYIDVQNIKTIATSQYVHAIKEQYSKTGILSANATFSQNVANNTTINILDNVQLKSFNNTNISLKDFILVGGVLKFPNTLGAKGVVIRVNVKGNVTSGGATAQRLISYDVVRGDNTLIAGQNVIVERDTIDRYGQVNLITFVSGRNDPFYTSGIKINFTNKSGATVNVTGADLLIELF